MDGTDCHHGAPQAETEELPMQGQPRLCGTVLGNKHTQRKSSALKAASSAFGYFGVEKLLEGVLMIFLKPR